MPKKISTLLKITSKKLDQKGAFDGFIDLDSRLHVDPSLLSSSKIPEFKNSHAIFEKYFIEILALVSNSKARNDRLWREAHTRLQFKEIGNTALGYSKKGTGGNAIGQAGGLLWIPMVILLERFPGIIRMGKGKLLEPVFP